MVVIRRSSKFCSMYDDENQAVVIPTKVVRIIKSKLKASTKNCLLLKNKVSCFCQNKIAKNNELAKVIMEKHKLITMPTFGLLIPVKTSTPSIGVRIVNKKAIIFKPYKPYVNAN